LVCVLRTHQKLNRHSLTTSNFYFCKPARGSLLFSDCHMSVLVGLDHESGVSYSLIWCWPAEEMPELRRVQLGLRIRHGHAALAHPTEQQRIDHATAAAAAKAAKARHADELGSDAEEAEQHNLGPNKRRKLVDKPATAAAGQQGEKAGRKGAAAGAGQLQKWGSGAAAAAAAAVGSGDEAGGGRAGRKRQGAVQKFIKGVNKGKAYDVRQAQDRARAQKAAAAAAAGGAPGAGRGRGRGPSAQARSKQDARAAAAAAAAAEEEADYYEDQHDAMYWEVQGDAEAAAGESVGRQVHHQQQHTGLRLGRHHRLGLPVQPVRYDRQLMKAKLHCRLVVLPKEGQQQPQRRRDIIDVSEAEALCLLPVAAAGCGQKHFCQCA
jgi:hypothetical protein